MFHFNEGWRQGSLQERIEELSSPQIYLSPTLFSFYDARQEVQPTSLIRACLNGNFQIYGKAIINFHNVCYRRISEDKVQLEDVSGELGVGVISPKILDLVVEQQRILDGDRVHLASISYQKSYDMGYLFNIKKSSDIGFPQLAPSMLRFLPVPG